MGRAAACAVALAGGCSLEGPLPRVFNDEPVISGLELPTTARFTRDGQVFIGEKKGIVRHWRSLEDAEPTVVLDLRDNVYDYYDLGLLSIELDPAFPFRQGLWAAYTYDGPIGGSAPTFHDTDTQLAGAASARLSRFELSEVSEGRYRAGPETVLIHDWCQVFTSHSVGSVRFGPDGALYVSAGDAARFLEADWGQFEHLCGDPSGEGGALRSQDLDSPGDPVSLDGTIIRVDPLTGAALPDNPFAGGASSGDDRVVAWGFRNPFRFTFRPDSRELWVGDVGWGAWEEVNRLKDPLVAENFGWPCFEGGDLHANYGQLPFCQDLAARAKANPGLLSPPFLSYHHNEPTPVTSPCKGIGAAITGLAFYSGKQFPARYTGALFVADYARNCIFVVFPDADGLPDSAKSELLTDSAKQPVDLQQGPDGALYYLDPIGGTLRRVRWGHPSSVVERIPPEPRAPRPRIEDPASGEEARRGDVVQLSGTATDADGNDLPASALSWNLTVLHCSPLDPTDCHVHPISEIKGAKGSFVMPRDHEYPSYVVARLRATVVEKGRYHDGDALHRVTYPKP